MKDIKFIITTCLLLACVGFCIWMKFTTPKVAYVRTADLVEKYVGMKEAKNIYKQKMGSWQSNIDTLENEYQRSVSRYNLDVARLSGKEKQEREEILRKQQINIQQYVKALEQKAQDEDNKMTEGVLNQINSFVKGYGEQHGYDMIFGITIEGNIMYGKQSKDVTDEVLAGLNESYKNSGK